MQLSNVQYRHQSKQDGNFKEERFGAFKMKEHATLERIIFHIEDIHAIQKCIISIISAIVMKKMRMIISILLGLKIILFKLHFYKLIAKSIV